jgi:hypothetical protein
LSAHSTRPTWLIRAPVVLLLALVSAFSAGIVWYHAPADTLPRAILALAWFVFALTCAVEFIRKWDWRALAALAPPLAIVLTWFILIEPTNNRVWSPEMAQLLTYTRDGDTITIKNVRNFNWTGADTANEKWETRRYALSELEYVDVLSLYWKGPRVAHTYFSFVWANGEALSLSVEIRKEVDENYSPVAGFFKAYELSILAGDERDFYGWRIHFPKEDLQRFRTRADTVEAGKLLVTLLEAANDLAAHPEFYNTLTENCTTEVWMLTDALASGEPLDWRMFASGYLPDFLYDLKILDTTRPLAELRDRAHTMPAVRKAMREGLTGAAFSTAIRNDTP